MGLFKLLLSAPPSPPPLPDPWTDVQRRLAELEHGMKLLRLEWEETYDKVHRLLGKVARRSRDLQREAEAPPEIDERRPEAVSPGQILRAARARHGGSRGVLR